MHVKPRLNSEQFLDLFSEEQLGIATGTAAVRSETHLNIKVTLYTSPPSSSTMSKDQIASFLIVKPFSALAALRGVSVHIFTYFTNYVAKTSDRVQAEIQSYAAACQF